MTLTFRPTEKPHCYDLMEEENKVGELICHAPEEEGGDPWWAVEIWSVMGTGKTWGADVLESHEEAAECARDLYEELVNERLELGRGARPRTVSTPMGRRR